MRLYLAVTPDNLTEAARHTKLLAHTAYRIGPQGQLMRRNLLRTRGGLMMLSDGDCTSIQDGEALCRSVWQECGNRGFGGVVADLEGPYRPDRASFLQKLSIILARNGRQLFVPEQYGQHVPQSTVLICTAISGGTLTHRLENAQRRFGPRLALDLQRLRMNFPLPCPSGEGTPLSGEALQKLMDTHQPTVFYSADLCAKYFTVTRGGESRFILFDDADTILKKIQIGRKMAISSAFLMYPETDDLLERIFSVDS